MSWTDSTFVRAAASSRASGMPSRRRQISTTAAALSGVTAKPGTLAAARSTNSRTDSLAAILREPVVDGVMSSAGRRRARVRHVERRDGQDSLASEGERLPARGEDGHARAVGDDRLDHVGCRCDEVLAIVERHQELLEPQEVDECLKRRLTRRLSNAEGAANLANDGGRVHQRRELDDPGAVPVAVDELRGCLEQHPGLPGTTDPRERDHPMVREQPADLGELALAADEGRQLDRQVREMRFKRAERREFVPQAGRPNLEHPLRAIEVSKAVVASIDELVLVGWSIAEQRPAGARDEDLAAVADREEARHPVEHRSEVVAVAALGGSGVDRHPDAERPGCAPGVRGKRPLSGDRRPDRGVDAVEHGKQPVAGRLDDGPAGSFDRGCEQAIVGFERDGHRLAMVLPEAGAALDVGEQERPRRRDLVTHVERSPAAVRVLPRIDTWSGTKS